MLESPQLANVEFKFPVMHEVIQRLSLSLSVSCRCCCLFAFVCVHVFTMLNLRGTHLCDLCRKLGGQIPWNVTPVCETSQICFDGRRPVKDVLGIHFDLLFQVSPKNCEGPVKNSSVWKENITWIVPWIRSVRGVGRVRRSGWTLRSWRRWTHRKSTQKDSMRKR